MKRFFLVPLMLAVLAITTAQTAFAGYCGASSFRFCSYQSSNGCDPCHTVMKTVREVHYEQRQFTVMKNVHETVYEDRTYNVVKYVPETTYKNVEYTVQRPVWETKTRTYTYNVMHPV